MGHFLIFLFNQPWGLITDQGVISAKRLHLYGGKEEPKNVLGYVYETFYIGKTKGYSIITEKGIALGCF